MHMPCRSTRDRTSLAALLAAPGVVLAAGASLGVHLALGVAVVLFASSGPQSAALPEATLAEHDVAVVVAASAQPRSAQPSSAQPSSASASSTSLAAANVEPLPPTQQPALPPPANSSPARQSERATAQVAWKSQTPPQEQERTAAQNQPAAVSFAGLSSQGQAASVIIFAIDLSGPMLTAMPLLSNELLASISQLQADQRYAIVAFSLPAGAASPQILTYSPPRSTSRGRRAAKPTSELELWLAGLRPAGSSVPLSGLRAALSLAGNQLAAGERAVVFLFCRSINRTEGNTNPLQADALAELDALNPADAAGRRRIVIKAVEFIDADRTGMLDAILQQHGGGKNPRESGALRTIVPEQLGR